MTALRFQTGGRHQTSPASLRGKHEGKCRLDDTVGAQRLEYNIHTITRTVNAYSVLPFASMIKGKVTWLSKDEKQKQKPTLCHQRTANMFNRYQNYCAYTTQQGYPQCGECQSSFLVGPSDIHFRVVQHYTTAVNTNLKQTVPKKHNHPHLNSPTHSQITCFKS